MSETGGPQILVVDDEVDLAETYTSQLSSEYDVEAVCNGPAALEALSPSVDIVLLDRTLPERSSYEVLRAIRERGLETRVAIVTAEEADFDIIELPIDDYVEKPVSEAALLGTVAQLLRCLAYDEQLQEYYALTAKRAALIQSKSLEALAESEKFSALEADIEKAKSSLSEVVAGFEPSDFDRAFQDIDQPGHPTAD